MDPKEFTSEDWYNVLEGIGAVTGMIVVADMSGPSGLMKEASAAAGVLQEGKWQSPFIAALRTEVLAATKERQEELKKIAEAKQAQLKDQKLTKEQSWQMGLDTIRNSVVFVEGKAGAEAAAEFKLVLGEIAQKTAEAAKEGGFFGMGGKPISQGEQAALDAIKAALA
jgi:uncharacterized protein YgfB (UPF0149 family)